MKYEYLNLKRRIRNKFRTQNDFADAMNLSLTSLSMKLNGRRDWNELEIQKIIKLLELEPKDIPEYFSKQDISIFFDVLKFPYNEKETNSLTKGNEIKAKESEKTLSDYINALIGISYFDWQRLRHVIDDSFDYKQHVFNCNSKLGDQNSTSNFIYPLLEHNFDSRTPSEVAQDVLEDSKKHNIPAFQAVINRKQLFDNFKNREE